MIVPFRRQQRDYWCGPACVQMVLQGCGEDIPQAVLAKQLKTNRLVGTLRLVLVRVLRRQGCRVHVVRWGTLQELASSVPAVVSYQEAGGEDHYAVVLRVTSSHVVMHDPWHGPNYKLTRVAFCQRWKNPKLRKKYTGWFVQVG